MIILAPTLCRELGMKGFLATSVNTLLIMLLTLAAAVASADTAVPYQQHPGQNGLYKAAQMSKASTPLVRVFSEYRVHANQGRRTAFAPSDQFLPFSAGRVLVDARATANGAAPECGPASSARSSMHTTFGCWMDTLKSLAVRRGIPLPDLPLRK